MHIKRRKNFVWSLAIIFLLTQAFISPVFSQSTAQASETGAKTMSASGTTTDRLAGADRYQTAVAVSQKGWETSDYAVLARGDHFADALCAGPLAQKYGGPILLTASNQLNADTLTELQRLGVKHLFIAGGLGAVSQSVEDALKTGTSATIERIYGDDRYETSVKIAQKIGNTGKVVLATGSDFPDALSISGIAAKLGMPILLTAKDSLSTSISDYFHNNTVRQTYVVGGIGVISENVANSVPGPTRLAGIDRYATNVAILQNFASELNFDTLYVAIGTNFADALTGAVLAAKSSSPLVLTAQTLPAGTANHLQTKLKLSSKVLGLGGSSVVPSAVLTGLVIAKEQIPVEEKYSTAGTYGPETGSKTIQGSVIISAPDVTLKNTIIEGDLLLGGSIGDGNVTLRDVTVKGKTIINGGGPNSIIMYNFNGQSVVVDVPDGGNVRLVAQGTTSLAGVSMESDGILEAVGASGSGFVDVVIPAGVQVTFIGAFAQVNVESSGASINLPSGSSITTLNANAASNITGQGQITTANINAGGVTIERTPTNTTTVASGLTAMVGGVVVSGTNNAPPGGGGGGGGPVVVTAITVTGNAVVGEILTATPTPAGATGTYQWTISDTAGGTYINIAGATSSTYTPIADNAGKFVKATITGTGSYTGTQTSTEKGPIIGATINIAAIPGVTAPVNGAMPVTTITATDQYTGTVAWSPTHATFAGGTVYTATITLTAKTGYTLTGVAENFFTVAGATTNTNFANSGVVTAVFPATAATVINIAAIPGVTAPVNGATPVTTTTATEYTGTVAWSPAHATFAVSTVYTATITLTAKAGYTLTGVAENFFTVAGATTNTNPANSGVVTAVFPATALNIGDTYGGGIVAYILQSDDPGYDANEQHGLIATTADQSTGIQWAILDEQIGGTSPAYGTGSANTDKIIAQNGAGTEYAAGLARAYNGGGKSDWYLPSKDELSKILASKNIIGGFYEGLDQAHYWNSTENDYQSAYRHTVWAANWGQFDVDGKWILNYVRAVRTF